MEKGDIWLFLENELAKEKASQVSCVIDSDDPQAQRMSKYISNHALLPEGYDKIQTDKIVGMGELLLDKTAEVQAKATIMMILAHHPSREALKALRRYNANPDKELKDLVPLAIEECEWWGE